MQPILIDFSNRIDPAYPLSSSMVSDHLLLLPLKTVIDTISLSIGNIDNAKLKFNSYISQYIFVSKKQFETNLAQYYKSQLLTNFYKLIGSLSLIGNPIGLLTNIGTGVYSFFYEPINGIKQGPNEVSKGFQKGTMKLLSNVSYGVLNTTGKILNTLGDGMAHLTISEDYKRERASGKKGLFHGLTTGLNGIINDPIQGAKKNGFVGALKGIGKGVLGVVVKPISGAIDEVSNAIDNAKQMTNTDANKNKARVRYPKYIPFSNQLYNYDLYLAYGQYIYMNVRTQFSIDIHCANQNNININERYVLHSEVDFKKYILLLSENHVFMLTSECVVMWCYNISTVLATYEKTQLKLYEGKSKKNNYTVVFDKEEYAKIFRDLINLMSNKTKDIIQPHVNQFIELMNSMFILRGNDSVEAKEERKHAKLFDIKNEVPQKALITDFHNKIEKKRIIGDIQAITTNYTEYCIHVYSDRYTWVIFRRYDEFKYIDSRVSERRLGIYI